MSAQHLIEMPAWECVRLLGERSIGRLTVVEGGFPVAFPISYALAARAGSPIPSVIVRTRFGGVIERALGHASLEVDEIDAGARRAWSVIVRGVLGPVDDPAALSEPRPWLSDDRHLWLALEPLLVTGRRFIGVDDRTFDINWEFAPG